MQQSSSKMKGQSLLLDTLSSLPPNVIEKILTLLPMRDAFRTSVLSRNWRYRCVNIPELVFDDKLFEQSVNAQLTVKCKLLHVVYPILLLHQAPVLDFTLSISQLQGCAQIDQIIHHLWRSNSLEKFTLQVGAGNDYKLPSTFFSLQRLTHLNLQLCAFQPPPTFYGFSKLTSLCFKNVSITAKMLLLFISSCPLLKSFTLIEDVQHFTGGERCDFIELFECLPLIELLCMNQHPIQCFAAGGIPQKLPAPLIHLRDLDISGACFFREDEFFAALFLIRSSPNLERIKIELCYHNGGISQALMDPLVLQDQSAINLDHLKELEIVNFPHLKLGLEFVKLILTKSSVLKKVQIVSYSRIVSINDEVTILRDLVRFPRASSKAEIKFERL